MHKFALSVVGMALQAPVVGMALQAPVVGITLQAPVVGMMTGTVPDSILESKVALWGPL
jgi:hypothetical protein